MRKNLFYLTFFASCCLFASCATIFSGGSPKIKIDSDFKDPVTITTTKATYENVTLPYTVKVRRKKIKGQHIQITSEKYKFADIVLKKKTNPWAWGNILIGGIPGLIIDLSTNNVSKPAEKHYFVQPLPDE